MYKVLKRRPIYSQIHSLVCASAHTCEFHTQYYGRFYKGIVVITLIVHGS